MTVTFMYLITFLRDNCPLCIVSHLTMAPEHFKTALQLLKKEYMDVHNIIDIYVVLLDVQVEQNYDKVFIILKYTLKKVRAIKFYPKTHGFDFTVKSYCLLSHVVISKPTKVFLNQLVRKIGNIYPNNNEMLDNC